jgi:hypothetical protein
MYKLIKMHNSDLKEKFYRLLRSSSLSREKDIIQVKQPILSALEDAMSMQLV